MHGFCIVSTPPGACVPWKSWCHHEWLRALTQCAYLSTSAQRAHHHDMWQSHPFWSGTSAGVWDISPVQPKSTTAAKTHGMKTLAKAWTCVIQNTRDTLCVQGPSVIQSQLALHVAHFLLHLLFQCTTSSSRRTPFWESASAQAFIPHFFGFFGRYRRKQRQPLKLIMASSIDSWCCGINVC